MKPGPECESSKFKNTDLIKCNLDGIKGIRIIHILYTGYIGTRLKHGPIFHVHIQPCIHTFYLSLLLYFPSPAEQTFTAALMLCAVCCGYAWLCICMVLCAIETESVSS